MRETREQLKQRLQAAGLWERFLTIRDQLCAEGLTPAQARQEALRQVESQPIGELPQAAKVEAPTDGNPANPPPEQSLPDFSRRVPDDDAVRWVAENLVNPNVRPGDAPGGQAWGLLQWVRSVPANQTTFWGSIWPKLLTTGAALKQRQEPDQPEPVDEGSERVLELIEKLLKEGQEAGVLESHLE